MKEHLGKCDEKNSKKKQETGSSSDTTVWCGANGVRYSEDFRDVVYKINPNNLACVYKKMFEISATDNLRGVEIDSYLDEQTDKKIDESRQPKDESGTWATSVLKAANGKYKFDSPPPHRRQAQIVRSVSSAYNAMQDKDKATTKKEFRGWDVCPRPHSAESSGYQKFTIAETRDIMKKRSQSASAKLAMKRDKLRLNKTVIGFHPRSSYSGIRSTASTPNQEHVYLTSVTKDKTDKFASNNGLTSSNNSCPNHNGQGMTSIDQIQCEFEHFIHSKDHMRKYREEYTYKKMDMMMAPVGAATYPIHVPSSCIPVTLPIFQWPDNSHTEKDSSRVGTPNSTSSTPSPSSVDSVEDIRLNARKTSLRKRYAKSNVPDVSKKSPHFLLAQNGVLKMEFYTNPMTFEENDATQTPVVCRTRPTIPSNAHGTIYPSSTDTHSYVIRRQNGMP